MYLDAAGYLYPSGYQNFVGPNLGPNVAFNGGGSNGNPPPPVNFSRRIQFELGSFYLAAAWRDGLEVTVTGELCSSPQTCVVADSTTLTVNQSGPTLETFNWDDINKVVFESVKGSGVPVGFTQGYSFVLDNISIGPVRDSSIRFSALAAVPEQSTWMLMLLGFAGLGFAAYNRPTSVRSLLATFEFDRVLRKQKGPAPLRNGRGANGACWAGSASNAPRMDIASRQGACQSPIRMGETKRLPIRPISHC